jgi:hypothetical protein
MINVNNAAVMVVMVLAQQRVQRANAHGEHIATQWLFRQSLTNLVEEPLAAFNARPQHIKRLPLQDSVECSFETRMKYVRSGVIHIVCNHPVILLRLRVFWILCKRNASDLRHPAFKPESPPDKETRCARTCRTVQFSAPNKFSIS